MHVITDCHIHISPLDMFAPSALALMRDEAAEFRARSGQIIVAARP